MKTKTKFASNNVVCVFGDYYGVSIHLGNIDLRTNRLYTSMEGYDMIADNEFKTNHALRFFDSEGIEEGDCFTPKLNSSKINTTFHKFTACVDLKKEEISDVIKMCNK